MPLGYLRRIALLVALLAACAAQDINDSQVRPRSAPGQAPAAGSDKAPQTHTFVSTVEVVLVPVTVTDLMGRIVTGLDRTHFLIEEDKQPQKIEYFYSQDAPISVGIVFDHSGSMGRAIDTSRDAVAEFMKAANPEDEFFLITFAERPTIAGEFTDKPENIQGKLIYSVAQGQTALWDAVYLGVSKLRAARHAKKVLMVFSDGGENHSRYSFREMLRFAREADVQIYGIAIPGADYGPWGMTGLSDATGGRTFTAPPSTFSDTAAKIAIELRNQYVLGYRPTNRKHDGKLRKIRVRLQPPRGLPALHASTRKTGYYAPTD